MFGLPPKLCDVLNHLGDEEYIDDQVEKLARRIAELVLQEMVEGLKSLDRHPEES